jgi:hypothetical protein
VDLDVDDEDDVEEIGTRVNRKWSKDQEKLLAKIWIQISQDKEMRNDRSKVTFETKLWRCSTFILTVTLV